MENETNRNFSFFFSKENLVTQVNVAEDFRNLLDDKTMNFVEEYLKLKRSLLENAFAQFVSRKGTFKETKRDKIFVLFRSV